MKRVLFILTIILLWSGCAHHYRLNRLPIPAFFQKLNEAAENQPARIELVNGEIYDAKNLQATSDSVFWEDIASGSRRSVGSAQVKDITVTNRDQGSIDGLKLGALAGGLTGTVVLPLIISGDDVQLYAMILPSVGLGGLAGFITGGIIGSRETFTFDYPVRKIGQQ